MQPKPSNPSNKLINLHMENTRRRKSSSGDAFSFPSTPTQDEDHYEDSSFEFGCITPDSPSSDPFKDSPADHLFFNGRLLPHAFPFQPGNGGFAVADDNSSRCFASRNSSISSKDSLTTSRSNSTNSRSGSSSSSSARTSYSADANYYSDRKLIVCGGRPTVGNKRASGQQVYGSSNRWQFITPAPSSSRRKMEELRSSGKKQDQDQRNKVVVRYQLGRRLFRWFVSACKECHAIEPSRKDKVLQPNVK